MSAQVFSGLRVVEFAEGMAGPMAGMIMADNGAEVIKVEPRGGDWKRASPGFLMWNRGKKGVCLDLENAEDRKQAVELALTADVVLQGFKPGLAERYGLDAESLCKALPDLVCCTLTGFGLAAKHEHLTPRPEIIFAKSGRANNNTTMSGAHPHTSGRPIMITSPYGEFGATGLALQGITAALLARERTGLGQAVTTSLLDGMVAASSRFPLKNLGGKAGSGLKDRHSTPLWRGITLCFLTPRCKDGRYIQMCARQDKHFRNWLQAMDLQHLLKEERYKDVPLGMKTVKDVEALEVIIRERMATKTMGEWMRIFTTELDVGGDPFLTGAEFLDHPQMVENNRIASIQDPKLGMVKQVGALALFSETPSEISVSAPSLGQHQAELPQLLKRAPQARVPDASGASAALSQPPLAGITILDLATFLAAPLGATILAELGARVIKIEPLEGDSYRRAGPESLHLMHGKESIAVDMKTAEGKAIFQRLVKGADALLHNMRPGVPDRLGMDYETARKINPKLIYVYGGSYGSKGPEHHRPAFHSTPHALCGAGILQGGVGNSPADDSYPDFVAAIAVGTALAMGLFARRRTGLGQYLETTMLTSSGYVNSERLVHYRGMPEQPSLDQAQLGLGALNRLYQTRDGWLQVCALEEAEWPGLARALGAPQWLDDGRFADAASRRQNDAALTKAVETALAVKDALSWEQTLNAAGVPVAAVSSSYEEFMVENKLVEPEEHAAYTYWRQKPRIRFSISAPRHGMPCALGEHSRALLAEVGYSAAEIDKFIESGVVGVPKAVDAAAAKSAA